jgi:hypothetical protein
MRQKKRASGIKTKNRLGSEQQSVVVPEPVLTEELANHDNRNGGEAEVT